MSYFIVVFKLNSVPTEAQRQALIAQGVDTFSAVCAASVLAGSRGGAARAATASIPAGIRASLNPTVIRVTSTEGTRSDAHVQSDRFAPAPA